MCKIKLVTISQLKDENSKTIGMQYLDKCIVISNYTTFVKAFDNFKLQMSECITDNQSILLGRDDVKRLALSIAEKTSGYNSKEIFKLLKDYLKCNYDVKRIIMNPRTLEYYPLNKVFIIHKL